MGARTGAPGGREDGRAQATVWVCPARGDAEEGGYVCALEGLRTGPVPAAPSISIVTGGGIGQACSVDSCLTVLAGLRVLRDALR